MYMIKELYNKVELYGKGTYYYIILMESKDYNLSLDVANFLLMALGSDTHTFSLA